MVLYKDAQSTLGGLRTGFHEKNASIISIHHLRICEHHISFKKSGKGRVTWPHRKGNTGVEVKSITVQVKSGFLGISVVSSQSTLGIKTHMLLIKPGLHLRIYPTVIAASVQNDLCVKLFILAVLVIIQEEQSQLLVEN